MMIIVPKFPSTNQSFRILFLRFSTFFRIVPKFSLLKCAITLCDNLCDSQVESWRVWSDFDDGWAGEDGGIGEVTGVVTGQEDVALTLDHGWNDGLNHTVGNT
jgi:hypothetical protein